MCLASYAVHECVVGHSCLLAINDQAGAATLAHAVGTEVPWCDLVAFHRL